MEAARAPCAAARPAAVAALRAGMRAAAPAGGGLRAAPLRRLPEPRRRRGRRGRGVDPPAPPDGGGPAPRQPACRLLHQRPQRGDRPASRALGAADGAPWRRRPRRRRRARDPGERAERREDAIRLQEALARMRANYREAIVLRFGLGLSVPEIAEHLQISLPAAKKLVLRATAQVGSGWRRSRAQEFCPEMRELAHRALFEKEACGARRASRGAGCFTPTSSTAAPAVRFSPASMAPCMSSAARRCCPRSPPASSATRSGSPITWRVGRAMRRMAFRSGSRRCASRPSRRAALCSPATPARRARWPGPARRSRRSAPPVPRAPRPVWPPGSLDPGLGVSAPPLNHDPKPARVKSDLRSGATVRTAGAPKRLRLQNRRQRPNQPPRPSPKPSSARADRRPDRPNAGSAKPPNGIRLRERSADRRRKPPPHRRPRRHRRRAAARARSRRRRGPSASAAGSAPRARLPRLSWPAASRSRRRRGIDPRALAVWAS